MHILIADLHENAAGLSEQFASDSQSVSQIGQIRMNAELPGIAEGAHLFRLASSIFGLSVFHITLAGAHLPV